MSRTDYQARFLRHAYLERERPTFLSLEVYEDGALAIPSAGTISIFNASGIAVVDAVAVTVASSIATYTLAAITVADEGYGAGWRVEWSLTMPDAGVHGFRQNASLVRFRLYPVITDADLYRRHTDLAAHLPSGLSSYEPYIEEAWVEVESRLEMQGRRPFLVLSPEALRSVHLYGALKIICRDFAGTGAADNKWTMLAEHYEEQEEKSWTGVNFIYDQDNDGRDDARKRRGGLTSLWLGSVK